MSFRFETILRLNKNKEDLLQRDMGLINAMIQKQKDIGGMTQCDNDIVAACHNCGMIQWQNNANMDCHCV